MFGAASEQIHKTTGIAMGQAYLGIAILLIVDLVLALTVWRLFSIGYKIKA